MKNRKDKTQYLFDSIGEIDDSLLADALAYKPIRRKRYNLGLVAACLALLIAVALIFPMLQSGFVVGESEKTDEGMLDVKNHYDSLDSLMLGIRDSGEFKLYESAEELSFESACIVWKYDDSDGFYVKRVSNYQLEQMSDRMGKGSDVGERSPNLSCQVWIVDNAGVVRSPYLKDTAGNEGLTVFNYEAEIIPNDDLINCISEMLT